MSMYDVVWRSLTQIKVAPENAELYRPVTPSDPTVQGLAQSIKKFGILEPLVISLDDYLLSGEQRLVAARLARRKRVPVRIYPIRRGRKPDRFVRLLREFNRQRLKSNDQKLREEVVSCDNDGVAYQSLLEYRERDAELTIVDAIELREEKPRCRISEAKRPFLEAIKLIVKERRIYWPLTVRQIHYILLNDPPLKHASKPDSVYRNDRASYQALDELTVRARLAYEFSPEAIDDETRPLETWAVHQDVQPFVQEELWNFLQGYRRNLMQSQPNHIEIVVEKLTVQSIVRPVAEEYCIPYTIGRGFANLPVRQKLEERFLRSGKKKLVLLFLADHDPDGEEIVHSFCRSMRDDFSIDAIEGIKVALTAEQVAEFGLPEDNLTQAKATSPNYSRFVEKYGESAYELEAASPGQLQDALRQAIDSVLDHDALDLETDAALEDAIFLEKAREEALKARSHLNLGS